MEESGGLLISFFFGIMYLFVMRHLAKTYPRTIDETTPPKLRKFGKGLFGAAIFFTLIFIGFIYRGIINATVISCLNIVFSFWGLGFYCFRFKKSDSTTKAKVFKILGYTFYWMCYNASPLGNLLTCCLFVIGTIILWMRSGEIVVEKD